MLEIIKYIFFIIVLIGYILDGYLTYFGVKKIKEIYPERTYDEIEENRICVWCWKQLGYEYGTAISFIFTTGLLLALFIIVWYIFSSIILVILFILYYIIIMYTVFKNHYKLNKMFRYVGVK